jgi:crossover junction endodeoxyribonuclease RuvC
VVKIAPLQKTSKIILGIDPGTVIMGFGLISVVNKEIQLQEMGVLKLSATLDAYEKLEKIHHRVAELITLYQPDCFAIEAPFFGKNVQSMLKLGRAQGVAIAAAMQAGLTVNEYSPKKVKMSITGNGNASKEQVLKMLQRMLNFVDEPQYFDATDALSVAVCHHFQDNPLLKSSTKKVKDWADFVNKNPGRVL